MASSSLSTAAKTETQKQKTLLAGETGLFTAADEATKSSADTAYAATDDLESTWSTTASDGKRMNAYAVAAAEKHNAEVEAAATAAELAAKKRSALLGSDYGSALDVGNTSAMRLSLLGQSNTTFGN